MRNIQFLKRTVSPLVLASAMMLAGVSAPTVANAQDGDVAGEIRFSWWGGPGRNEKTDKILSLFEESNPGVTVLRENSGWQEHWDKLTIQSSAGNQPCTIQMQSRWLATYAKPNILMPLDDLLAAGAFNVEGISAGTLKTGVGDDGQLYMIPSGVFFSSLMYNQTWLENAGLSAPAADWDWEDFAQLLRDIKPTLPEGVYPSHNMGQETDSFVNYVQSQGEAAFTGNAVGFSKATMIDWFNYWEGLRKEGLTESPEVMIEENGSLIEESAIANGRTFITPRPANRLDSHQVVIDAVRPGEQLMISRYPLGTDGSGQDTGANGIAIGASCPEELIPAAVAWVNFFTQDPEAAAIYESDNGVVAIDRFQKDQAENPNTSRGQREQILLFSELSSTDQLKPVAWPAGGNGAITEALGRAYQAVAFEISTPEEATDTFFEEMETLLD